MYGSRKESQLKIIMTPETSLIELLLDASHEQQRMTQCHISSLVTDPGAPLKLM
jgi:hypothetical protein